jgi:hypothetical protein
VRAPVALVLLASGCLAPPDRAVLSVASRHEDRETGLDEFNPGLGLEWDLLGGLSSGLGAYRNSFGDLSPYAGVQYRVRRESPERVSPGALVGVACYDGQGPLLLAGPFLEFRLGPVRPRVLWIPDVGQFGGHVFALQVGVDL